jgi:hypothetical protein
MLLTVGHLVDNLTGTSAIQVSADIPSKPPLSEDRWLIPSGNMNQFFVCLSQDLIALKLFNSLATGPVKTSPILEYYFQVFCKFHIFGSVHAM